MTTPERPSLADTLARIDAVLDAYYFTVNKPSVYQIGGVVHPYAKAAAPAPPHLPGPPGPTCPGCAARDARPAGWLAPSAASSPDP